MIAPQIRSRPSHCKSSPSDRKATLGERVDRTPQEPIPFSHLRAPILCHTYGMNHGDHPAQNTNSPTNPIKGLSAPTIDGATSMPAKDTASVPRLVTDFITAHNISIGFPHTTEAGWRLGVAAKEKYRPTPTAPLRVEMWWPFDHPDPSERDIDRLADFLTSNNLQLIAMNLWAGDMAAGERGVLHREPLPPSHIDAVTRIHELTGVSKFNLLVGRRGEDADSWETQCERFVQAVTSVHRATGGMVLVENMSGIEDYPIKRVREAFELTWQVGALLDGGAEHGLAVDVDDALSAVETEGVGVLFDVYHFLTNWQAGIENDEVWYAEELHELHWQGGELGEENPSSCEDDVAADIPCPVNEVGMAEVLAQLQYRDGCMTFLEHVAHWQIASWPDRGEPLPDDDQLLAILHGIRNQEESHRGRFAIDIVGEWLPRVGKN